MPYLAAPVSRAELERAAGRNLAKESWTKPELRPIALGGVPCLVKDYGRRPFLLRQTLGRLNISREAVVYDSLRGVPGVPRCFGRIGAFALVLERIEGEDLRRADTVPPGFFDRLDTIVARLHSRGVVHGDLRQRRNVLVDADGAPWIVDFASGIRLPPGSALLRLAARADRSGVAKLRVRFAPDTVTEEDRRLLSLDHFRPLKRWRLRRRERRGPRLT